MPNRIFDVMRNCRSLALAAVYAAVLASAFYLAYEVRFDFSVDPAQQAERLQLLWVVIGLKLGALLLSRQFGSMLTYFSLPDLMRLIWAMTLASLLLYLPRGLGWSSVPLSRGMLLVDYVLCVGGLCAVRLGMRMYRERLSPARKADRLPQQRIAIVGAGDAGASLAREFLNTPSRGFKPVMFFDDDSDKHGVRVHGVPVVGVPEQIAYIHPRPDVAKVVIAMPSAPPKRIREVVLLLTELGYKVETLPGLDELASGKVTATRLRPVQVEDLLGREPVKLDNAAIRQLVENRVVMVTGAGGSIGSELCRQIVKLHPERLLMVEQAESSLFIIEQELRQVSHASTTMPLVGDILGREQMEAIFSRYRPEIVFHAAAHKHVPLMEYQPAEAFRNNVLGTRLLAELAAQHAVATFVLISTDKAINPTSVMGATKRLAEIEVQAAQARWPGTKFMAVRFGNVLGSSGSVVQIFRQQIAMGGPVTVTHPEVTRYFMTIREATGLVLQSTVLGKGGEIFVLDMGEAVKIVDLARQMIELSGYRPNEDIEIRFTGLRPGEKLFEELQYHDEQHMTTAHPKIMRFLTNGGGWRDNTSALRQIEDNLYALSESEMKIRLRELVREYTPQEDRGVR